jgi:hypothetical protein
MVRCGSTSSNNSECCSSRRSYGLPALLATLWRRWPRACSCSRCSSQSRPARTMRCSTLRRSAGHPPHLRCRCSSNTSSSRRQGAWSGATALVRWRSCVPATAAAAATPLPPCPLQQQVLSAAAAACRQQASQQSHPQHCSSAPAPWQALPLPLPPWRYPLLGRGRLQALVKARQPLKQHRPPRSHAQRQRHRCRPL